MVGRIRFSLEGARRIRPSPAPPRNGDQWRVNFSRVEWRHEIVDGKYRKIPKTPEANWVGRRKASSTCIGPTWGYVQFSTAEPGKAAFRRDPAGPIRDRLMQYLLR